MNITHEPPTSPNTTLVDLLRYRAEHQKDKTAYIFLIDGEKEEIKLTYGQLDTQARAIAAKLQEKFSPGDRAILLYPPGLEFISGFFGCLYAGIIAVPVYPPNPADMKKSMDKLKGIISNCQPKVALTTKDIILKLRLLSVRYSALRKMKLIASDNVKINSAEKWKDPEINDDDLAYLQYTSGSTGTPKGVIVSHKNTIVNIRMMLNNVHDTENSIFFGWVPTYHDLGLVGHVFYALYVGGLSVLMSPIHFLQKPVRWLKGITKYKVTGSSGPNFACNLVVNKITDKEKKELNLSSLDLLLLGAEPIKHTTLKNFTQTFASCGLKKQALYPCYGLAEATLSVSGSLKKDTPIFLSLEKNSLKQNLVKEPDKGEPNFIVAGSGRPLPKEKLLIVDSNTLGKCPDKKIGEIWVQGPNIAKGYWNNPEQTKETFHAYLADTGEGPFLRTGDLGFIKDRELFITGRLKDLIIIRGKNHYPQDIELTVEQSYPAFRHGCSAAFSVDVQNEEQLVIVQEIKSDYINKVNTDEAVSSVRTAVAQNHELDLYAIVFIKPRTIPKTSSGKIRRRACKTAFLENKSKKIAKVISEPLDSIELSNDSTILETLKNAETSQWQAILHSYLQYNIARSLNVPVFQVDTEKSLISLGINSLKVADLKGTIDEELGIDMDITKLMEGMSILDCSGELASLLSDINFAENNKSESEHNRYQKGRI
jgi:acyl-CoA synthetase (AMP-forming)/AMP-acid ligase II/acyl carrier protein